MVMVNKLTNNENNSAIVSSNKPNKPLNVGQTFDRLSNNVSLITVTRISNKNTAESNLRELGIMLRRGMHKGSVTLMTAWISGWVNGVLTSGNSKRIATIYMYS